MSATDALTLPKSFSQSLASAAYLGGVGAITAGLCTTINPVVGAFFTISSAMGANISKRICEMSCPTTSKTAEFAINRISGIGLGLLTTTLMGHPLSIKVAILMTVGAFGTHLFINWVTQNLKTHQKI
ncbi:MAG: hypothetical protein K2P51_07515 [Rhabdochlamydiaceae bacterium]|nr:hypothetical protein [Rhabdochlamydiaceae bacterium]